MSSMKMNIKEHDASAYNVKLAEMLKEFDEFEQPEWVVFVKSGTSKQRPINEPDFWYKRAASILRQIYIREIVGVGRLRTRYGSRKDMGMAPPRFKKGAGKIIRVILQQAESAGLVEKVKNKETRAGRKLSVKGKELLESVKI